MKEFIPPVVCVVMCLLLMVIVMITEPVIHAPIVLLGAFLIGLVQYILGSERF